MMSCEEEIKKCAFCGYRYSIHDEIDICNRCLHDISTGEKISSMAIAFKLNARYEEIKVRRKELNGDDIALAKRYYGERYKNDRFINRAEAVKLAEKYGVRLDTVIDRLVRGDTIEDIEATYIRQNRMIKEKVNGKDCTIADIGRMLGKSVGFIQNRKSRFKSLQEMYDYLSVPSNMLFEEGKIDFHGEKLTYTDAAIRVGKKRRDIFKIAQENNISYVEAVDMVAAKKGLMI